MVMEPRTQATALSSSKEKNSPLVAKRPPWKKPTKHSTPEQTALGWSPRPRRGTSHLLGSPVPAHSSQDLVSHLEGVSPIATFRKRKLSTIRASEGTSEQLGSYLDYSVPGKDPPVPDLLTKQQQKAEVQRAKSWSGNSGLPGIPNTARRKRQDRKEREAVMQRVRQWEIHQLQEIEGAVQHELFIQVMGALDTGMEKADAPESASLA